MMRTQQRIQLIMRDDSPLNTGDFQLECYNEAEKNKLEKQAKEYHQMAKNADNSYLLHLSKGKTKAAQNAYKEVIKHYKAASTIYMKFHNPSIDVAHFYMDLANFYRTSNMYANLKEAILFYNNAIEIYDNAEPKTFLLQAYFNLAKTYYMKGECKTKKNDRNYRNAKLYFGTALELSLSMVGTDEYTAQCHHFLGSLCEKIAQLSGGLFIELIEESRINYIKALQCFTALGEPTQMQKIHYALAHLNKTKRALYSQSIANLVPVNSVQAAFFTGNNFNNLFWAAPVNNYQQPAYLNDNRHAQQSQVKSTFTNGKRG